jgi:hypothetical protein
LEGKDDVAVVRLGPTELMLQRGLEDRHDLPVHVIDRGREEQEAADDPADVSGA